MNIKDLEMSKELSHEERAVRGGAGNVAIIGGQNASNSVSGFAFGSPQSILQVGPSLSQSYAPVKVDVTTIDVTKTLDAFGSLVSQR